MSAITIMPVTRSAVVQLCGIMRKDDRLECEAILGKFDPEQIADLCTGLGGFGCVGYNKRFVPFFACGLMPSRYPRVMEAYAFGSDEFQGQMIRATKEVKKGLDRAQNELGVQVIMAHSQDRHVKAHRWLELLGFERAAVIPGMGQDGSDFFRFERRLSHA